MKNLLKKIKFISILLATILLASSCSEDSCNKALLSFNNHLDYKIEVKIYGLYITETIEPGGSITVEVEPYASYAYVVQEFYSGTILIDDEITVDDCTSLGIDIN